MIFNSNGKFEATPIDTTHSIVSSVLVSLFSWRDQWFYRSMGTVLYKAHRTKVSTDTLSELKFSAEQSLQWLVDDSVVKSYVVKLTSTGYDNARLDVDLTLPDNSLKFVSVDV
jgi:phage gp46-like protein